MNWQTPQELPDLRRVGSVALDTETRDAGCARRAVHPLRRTDTSARWPRDLRPLCAGTVGMRRHRARAMSARRLAPTLYALAAGAGARG